MTDFNRRQSSLANRTELAALRFQLAMLRDAHDLEREERKFNPNHRDDNGQFTFASDAGEGGGGGGVTSAAPKSSVAGNSAPIATPSAREKLTKLQTDLVASPGLQQDPNTGETHCNEAVFRIATELNAPMAPLSGPDGEAKTANGMARALEASSEYKVVTPEEAQNLANEGKLVIGAWDSSTAKVPKHHKRPKHGHVLTVTPSAGAETGIEKSNVEVANLGPSEYTGIVKMRDAFGGDKIGKVLFYTPK